MYILGISAFYHDAAAALIKDGRVIYAAEEERFSRIKHDNQFPSRAIQFCLDAASISIHDVEAVSYYEKPLLKLERILDNFVQTYPYSFNIFMKGISEWLNSKIQVKRTIRQKLDYKGQIFFIPHHTSHASAAFYPSPFELSAIVTIDGVGEYQTTTIWQGDRNKIQLLKSINFPHSLGLLYSTFTAFLGFRVNDDEYKVMGLAAYGQPKYYEAIRRIVDIRDDGSFNLNLKFFYFHKGSRMWSRDFEALFGNPRSENEVVEARHADLAASIQLVTEEIYFKILRHAHKLTGCDSVSIGGGVALNALANGKIYEKTPFKEVYIFGPAGDSVGAIGSALFVYHDIYNKEDRTSIQELSLGSNYAGRITDSLLKLYPLQYKQYPDEDELLKETARLIAQNNVIGWFSGAMEFGPRALGSRSILANPRPQNMKSRVNEIKFREDFRPFGGSILYGKTHDYFILPEKAQSFPFMNFCFQTRPEKREEISAIVHADGTCRIQTVQKKSSRYANLLEHFFELTGSPCLLNTSFNVKGEPIVETPEQAIEDFLTTKMDYLVLENFIISKTS